MGRLCLGPPVRPSVCPLPTQPSQGLSLPVAGPWFTLATQATWAQGHRPALSTKVPADGRLRGGRSAQTLAQELGCQELVSSLPSTT